MVPASVLASASVYGCAFSYTTTVRTTTTYSVMSGPSPPTQAGKEQTSTAPTPNPTPAHVPQKKTYASPATDEVIEIMDDSSEPETTNVRVLNTTQDPRKTLMSSIELQNKPAASPLIISSSMPPSAVEPTENKVAAAVTSFRNEFVAQFQTSFQMADTPATVDPKAKKQSKLAPKQASFNRTSISSLMNSDEINQAAAATKQQEKKRKSSTKAETTSKKAKADPKKDLVPTAATASALEKVTKENIPFTSILTPEAPKKEPKKVVKKKTPETAASIKDKLSINPTITTNKQKITTGPLNLPNPAFLDLAEPGNLNKEAESKEGCEKTPVIFLDVPLLDPANPKPGQAEIVINVLKLAEDKYGWNAIHPDARSAIDMMDDILDDDDEGDDDEGDDDLQIIEDKSKKDAKESEAKSGSENNEDLKSRKWRAQQTKINRKVGKYDYEDPFIDDAELQWEEEITTTKEGFFVYWGPLVDERSSGTAKKGPGKPKK